MKITLEFPATIMLDVPNGKHLPDAQRQVSVDVQALAKHPNVLAYLFGRGVDHMKDAAALSEKDYPLASERAKQGRVFLIDRFVSLASGEIPTGGGGSPIHPKVSELRKMVVTDHKANGIEYRGKVVDIKTWSQCEAIATTMVKAIARVQKATLNDEAITAHVTGMVADWDSRIDAILLKQKGATPLVLTPDEVPAESPKS